MPKKLHLMLRLGLMTVLISQAISYRGASFVMVSEMRDIRFELWIISSIPAKGSLECSRKCETHGTCLSFQYSTLNGQCRLFNTIFLHQDAGVHDIGWQYYIASNRRCRHPFIDGRDLDICFMFAGYHNLTEGMEECAAIQSNIISITSAEQSEFLIRLAGIFTHISVPANSYRRPFIQGFWDGVDWILDNGNPLVYTNWASGQPEIANNKRFIKFRNGEWKTSIASNIRPVFCSYQQYMLL